MRLQNDPKGLFYFEVISPNFAQNKRENKVHS